MIWLNFAAVSTLHGSLPVADAEAAKTATATIAPRMKANLDKRMMNSSISDLKSPYRARINARLFKVYTFLNPLWSKTHLRFQVRGVYRTERSCRFPLIVLQQTTQSFLAPHNSVIPARPSIRQGEQEAVLLALVIALLVVMGHVLLQGSAQRSLSAARYSFLNSSS